MQRGDEADLRLKIEGEDVERCAESKSFFEGTRTQLLVLCYWKFFGVPVVRIDTFCWHAIDKLRVGELRDVRRK